MAHQISGIFAAQSLRPTRASAYGFDMVLDAHDAGFFFDGKSAF